MPTLPLPTLLSVPGEGRRGTTTVAGNQQPSIFMRLQRIQAFKYSSGRRRREAVGASRKGKKCREGASSHPHPPQRWLGHVRGQKSVFCLETRHLSVGLLLITFRGPGSSCALQSRSNGCWCHGDARCRGTRFTQVWDPSQGSELLPGSCSHLAASSRLCTSGGEGPFL